MQPVTDVDDETEDEPASRVVRILPFVALGLTLLLIAGTAGYLLGQDRAPSRNSAEVGFLYDMITHHEQAQYLSNLELVNGSEETIKVFAREILLFQSYEIGLMQARLEDWGFAREDPPPRAMAWMGHPVARDAMPGLASEAQIQDLLQRRGRSADALFVELMQAHHRGGVEMAEEAAERVGDGRVKALAASMARNQRLEIGELEAAEQKAGLSPADASPPTTTHAGH